MLSANLTERRIIGIPLTPPIESIAGLASGVPFFIEMIQPPKLDTGSWPGSRGMRWIATEHSDTGAKLRTAEGNHMLSEVHFS